MINSKRIIKKYALWVLFLAIIILAITTRKDTHIFLSESPHAMGKYMLWLLFFGFLGYTFYCSEKELFFKSLKNISKMYWGRQIGLDLYIGLLLPLSIIYFQGGVVLLLIWLLPIIIYANLATLLYFALNYDSLIAHFII